MLKVPTQLKDSELHGRGVFTTEPILKGTIVWRFSPSIDVIKPREECSVQENHFAYVNPVRKNQLVICGDIAKYMNFASSKDTKREANTRLGEEGYAGERDLVAACDIGPDEELTVPLDSDDDAERKLHLAPLIRRANGIVIEAIKRSLPCAPVVYFSGGKDSMVMLHLMREHLNVTFPVILHREPWQAHKFEFADEIVREWGLSAYDYPPIRVNLWMGKGIVAFTNHYQIGSQPDGRPSVLALPKNIVESDAQRPLCGLHEILERPLASFAYPWNLAFLGHKDCDEDQIAGKVPLAAPFVRNEHGPNLAYPLKDWAHSDVWDYIRQYAVPYQRSRYNPDTTEKKDKTYNPDYFEACIRCVDRRREGKVHCPLLRREIDSVADQVEYQTLKPDYILAE